MSKKNKIPQLTERKIICYAISYVDSKIDELEAKFANKDLSDPDIAMLRESVIEPFITEKELLIRRYELESGIEWQN